MATGIIPRTHVSYGEFRASLTSGSANQLSDGDGNPTSLVTSGDFPAKPQECIYQVVTAASTNNANFAIHLDGQYRNVLYVKTDATQSVTFRWYRII